jgi:RsiW-degrading membrane proteinase PrsW (M82 family)
MEVVQMILIVLIAIVSLIPSVALYFWMKNKVRKPEDEVFKQTCRSALLNGFLATLFILLISGAFAVIGGLLGIKEGASLPATAYHKFIKLAFAEELVKSLMLWKTLKKANYAYTWQDMIIFMVSVSIGFEILEAIVYAIGEGPIPILIRGILIMHGGFGFIEGWFYGKAKYTKNKIYIVIGFVIAWLLHGAYDFGLNDQFLALNPNNAYLSVSLAGFSLVLLVLLIAFFVRKRKPQYLEPLQ